jgi:hypothetical protein
MNVWRSALELISSSKPMRFGEEPHANKGTLLDPSFCEGAG